MKEFDLVYKDTCLHVVCENFHEKIIKDFVKNHYNIGNFNIEPTYTLNTLNNLKSRRGIFGHIVDKWFDNASLDCWIDNESKTCYFSNFDGKTIDIINLLQYFTINLFNRLLELKGYIALHSSAAEKKGNGVAFVAERNSGKTISLLNMMSAGYNSVTNDKLAVVKQNDNIDGYGVAQSVSIRMSPEFLKDPRNEKYRHWAEEHGIEIKDKNMLEGNRILLSDNELADLNGVKQVPSATIRAIIMPKYNSELQSIKINNLKNEELAKLINSQTISLVHETNSFFNNIKIKTNCVSKEDTLNKLLSLPAFKLEQNENTTNGAIQKIETILG